MVADELLKLHFHTSKNEIAPHIHQYQTLMSNFTFLCLPVLAFWSVSKILFIFLMVAGVYIGSVYNDILISEKQPSRFGKWKDLVSVAILNTSILLRSVMEEDCIFLMHVLAQYQCDQLAEKLSSLYETQYHSSTLDKLFVIV